MAESTKSIVEGKKARPSLKYQKEQDAELVVGVFRYNDQEGQTLEFWLKVYPKEEPVLWKFEDGKQYKIPLGVAKHLNKSGKIKQHKYAIDESGKPIYRIGGFYRRYGFESTEFIDPADLDIVDKSLLIAEPV